MSTNQYLTNLYLSAPEMTRLIHRKGLSACIAGVADRIEREFLRWNEFDKSARTACHSDVGVMEPGRASACASAKARRRRCAAWIS